MLFVILVAFVVTFAATPIMMQLARRGGIVDRPNPRSSHSVATPRIGGVAIVAGVACAVLAAHQVAEQIRPLLLCLGLIALLGFLDDLRGLRAELRLTIQLLAAAALALLAGWTTTGIDEAVVFPFAAGALFTVIWLVGLTNAYNFMDGINGIASVEALVAGTLLGFLAAKRGDTATAALALALAAAAAGFLPWNFPNARVFMGDVASGFFGFAFAALVVRYTLQGGSFVAAALPLAPFVIDTGVTLVRRARNRERLFSAHRSHFYQRLVMTGLGHALVTMIWGALAAVGALIALIYEEAGGEMRAAMLLGYAALHVAVGIAVTLRERRLRHAVNE